MKQLLEDYKLRLKNVIKHRKATSCNGTILHQRREERLIVKEAEYRAFITEIERVIESSKLSEEVIIYGMNAAYIEAGHNAYFGNGFKAGVQFAQEQLTK